MSSHPLVGSCAVVRRGRGRSLHRNPLRRRREVLAYTEMVIADAYRLHRGG